MGFVFFLVIIGVAFAIFMAAIKSAKVTKQNWAYVAKKLNMKYFMGSAFNPGIITGEYHGHHVKVETVTKGSGDSSAAIPDSLSHMLLR